MKEGLVNKLQASLSKFRNDRDQLHRSKELALERCRLIEEEVTVLSKTVDSLRQKHGQLQATRQSIEGDLGPLEIMVQRDTKEVRIVLRKLLEKAFLETRILTVPYYFCFYYYGRKMEFQHAELLGARAKIKQKTEEMKRSNKAREEHLFEGRQFVSQRRNNYHKQNQVKKLSALEEQKGLKRELDYDYNDFMDVLLACMEQRISQWEGKSQMFPMVDSDSSRQESLPNDMPPPAPKNGTAATISSIPVATPLSEGN